MTDVFATIAAEFAPELCYLNTASAGLPPRAAIEALQRGLSSWAAGRWTARQFDAVVQHARSQFAAIAQVSAEHVAVGANASVFVGQVVQSLPEGARVLCVRGQFTSLLFPALERARAGTITVQEVALEALAEAVDSKTTLVMVSAVQSRDGRMADLDAIQAAATAHGAQVLVDATQALGWLPLDASRFDYVVVSAYKWLMIPRGVAFMTVAPHRLSTLRAPNAGWYAGEDVWGSIYGGPLRLASDARRFDISPAWLCWLGAAPSLDLVLGIGVANIHAHNIALARAFAAGLGRPEPSSPIVSIPGERGPALRAAGINASERDGVTRVSFHLYNTMADVERVVEVCR